MGKKAIPVLESSIRKMTMDCFKHPGECKETTKTILVSLIVNGLGTLAGKLNCGCFRHHSTVVFRKYLKETIEPVLEELPFKYLQE